MRALDMSIDRLSLRKWLLLLLGGFFLLGFLVYGRSITYEFVEMDDALLIYENPKIQGYTLENFKKIFTTYDPELYIPITLLSYQFDYLLGGGSPVIYHLHNLLLHILNAFLFAVLSWHMLQSRSAGAIAGLLFLVHPLHSEAAVWASSRKDTISTLYFLLSVLSYVLYARVGKKWMYVTSLVTFALGLMSKVSIVPLPIALLLFDYLDRRSLRLQLLWNKIPYIALSVFFGIVAMYGKAQVQRPPLHDLTLMWIKSVSFFLQKMVWPTGFSILYPFDGELSLHSPAFLGPVLVLIALIVIIIVAAMRGRRFVAAGIAFFLLILAPSLYNLAKWPDYYLTSDRYAYVPSMGIFLLVAAGVLWSREQLRRRGWNPSLPFIASVMIIAALSIVTFLHIPVWRNHEVLARHVLSLYPNARIAYMDLGNALRDRGAFVEAHEAYDASTRIREDSRVHYNKALLLEMEDKPVEAQKLYERAVVLTPYYDLARINLGRLYHQQGKRAEAREQFEKAAHSAPHLAMPRFNLGVIAWEEGKIGEAEEHYRAAIRLDSRFADPRVNLIVLLLKDNRLELALTELQSALARIPGDQRFSDMREALEKQGLFR